MMVWCNVMLFVTVALASGLPDANFVHDFAKEHQRSSIIMHVPEDTPDVDCLNW